MLTAGGLKRCSVIHRLGGAMPVIGFLNTGTREGFAHYLAAFHQSLNQAGFVFNLLTNNMRS
jgi:hypothetical protein